MRVHLSSEELSSLRIPIHQTLLQTFDLKMETERTTLETERTGFNTHHEPHPSELLDAGVSMASNPLLFMQLTFWTM